MAHYFMIVVPTDGVYEIGLADGLRPWQHHGTFVSRDAANRACTLLAMYYKVPSRIMTAIEGVAAAHEK